MKKYIALVMALVCVMCSAGCSQTQEKPVENQVLTLSFELDNQIHIYNIEYDADNTIIKVDNTDYYDFLVDGELITDATVLDAELTDYFVRNGGKSNTEGTHKNNQGDIVEPYVSIPDFSYEEESKVYVEGMPGAKTSGFVNTSEVEINSIADAGERASKECTVEWDTVSIYLDTAACVWKVVFYTEGMLGGEQTVYLDYNGKTLLIVYGE